MGFIKIASVNDLKTGTMIGAKAGDKEVFVANVDGKFYAIGNECTHAGCMLSGGSLKGENVTCPCHMSVFSVRTGMVVRGPARKSEPAFQVKVEGDQLLVEV